LETILSRKKLNRAIREKSYGMKPTAAQDQWHREHQHKQAEYTRWKNTWLKFWQQCRIKACRRHHRCSGDEKACWEEKWPAFPPILKEQLKLAIKFMNEGMLPPEAFAVARTTLLRELEEQIAQAEQEAREGAAGHDGGAKSEVNADDLAQMQFAGTIEPPTPRVRPA
jgi:hypothetical protein